MGKLNCKNKTDSVQDVKADDLRQMFLAMTEEVTIFYDICQCSVLVLMKTIFETEWTAVSGSGYHCQTS